MKRRILISLMMSFFATSNFAATASTLKPETILLQKQPSFFRLTAENVKMPNGIEDTGLVGINYFVDFNPYVYGGIGGYGSVTGTQGGLFVLGFEGGLHKEFFPHWWGDVGMYVGGGGGRSALVGGGLMLRPHAGIQYDFKWARLGAQYSYITFPSGEIRSHQVGLDLDLPCDFYYVPVQNFSSSLFNYNDIHLFNGKNLGFQRNDFGLILQAYRQKKGIHNVNGIVQDGTISLVGAELDHYMTESLFWSVKAAGAYHGIPNGYMDVIGSLGYHWALGPVALVPQLGAGAGGGGQVNAGGGLLVQPQLGFEWPFSSNFAGRISGGYLWAPKGEFQAYTLTGELLYHLDIATEGSNISRYANNNYKIQGWRIQLLNQTYVHPQRNSRETGSAAELVVVQIDQQFTPYFFFAYQAASAYSGNHTGGYATGMIGPGIQTPAFLNKRVQLFAEVLVGAGGGGNLALEGGSLIEPVVGVHYAITPAIGLVASYSQIKALQSDLKTPVINLGLSVRFGTLNKE